MAGSGKEVRPDGPAVSWIDVGEDEAGQRVDNFLIARLKGVPKSHIYRVLRSGEVRVNSGRVDASRKLAPGDRIRVPPIRVAARDEDVPAPHFKLPILFEDDHILAIDKPAGIAVHGGSGVAHGVIESLRSMRPEARFLELVHRLDRDTSGVLLVAKKRSALTALHELMRSRDMDKRYLVGVKGRFRNEKQHVRASLEKRTTAEGEKRVRVAEGGQESETIFRRISRGEAGPGCRYDGMFLHARRLRLAHPATGATLELEAPLPPACVRLVEALERPASSMDEQPMARAAAVASRPGPRR
jgi:23S rRNA pseudouridine955/2504/2580 synthase